MDSEPRTGLSAIITGVYWLVTTYFLLSREALGVSTAYFSLYAPLMIVASIVVTFCFVMDLYRKSGSEILSDSGFVAEKADWRPLSGQLWIPLAVFLLLSVGVVALVSSNEASFFTVPYAYGDTLSATDSGVTDYGARLKDWFLGAVIPALAEDGVVIGLIFGSFILLKGLVVLLGGSEDFTDNIVTYTVLSIVIVAGAAYVFSAAHARYGANEAAFGWAWIFGAVIHLANLLTGTFLSPVVHFAHNAVVLANQWFSVVLFQAATPFLLSRSLMKNQLVLLESSAQYWARLYKSDFRRLVNAFRN